MEQAFSLRTQSRIYWLVLGTAAVTGSTKGGMLTWSQSSYWVNVTRWGLERTWYFISGPRRLLPCTMLLIHGCCRAGIMLRTGECFSWPIRLTRVADFSRSVQAVGKGDGTFPGCY